MKSTKLLLVLLAMTLCGCTNSSWQRKLKKDISVYGHRNWIVVADSAYPKQSAPGIETIYTDGDQLEVLQTVLDALGDSPHVQPIIMVDAELKKVAEADAPGVDAYRKELFEMLKGQQVKGMPHEDIIKKLDKASEMFNILLLKTNLIIPYTSVFLELDCGYWDAEREAKLRSMIEK